MPGQGSRSLAVIIDLQGDLAPGVWDTLRLEFERLWHQPDLRIEWRKLGDPVASEVLERIAVARFRGSCDASQPLPLNPGARTLGYAHVSDGAVLPFAEIDCNRIRELLGPVIRGQSRQQREVLVGRAIGRVLAHEVYHIVTRSGVHSRGGIACHSLTASELICEHFDFAGDCVHRIRQAFQLTRTD